MVISQETLQICIIDTGLQSFILVCRRFSYEVKLNTIIKTAMYNKCGIDHSKLH